VLVDRFVSFDAGGVEVRAPRRVFDSRSTGSVKLRANETITLDAKLFGTTSATTGVVLNLTATDTDNAGFLTAYPCDARRPATSNVNYGVGDVVANLVIVAPDADGDVCLFSLSPSHVVVDQLGITTAGFVGGAPQRLLDTRVDHRPIAWP
jgi:hypothetical protein